MNKIKVKQFEELTTTELYEILREGFKVCSDEFMDAGISHVKMILERI